MLVSGSQSSCIWYDPVSGLCCAVLCNGKPGNDEHYARMDQIARAVQADMLSGDNVISPHYYWLEVSLEMNNSISWIEKMLIVRSNWYTNIKKGNYNVTKFRQGTAWPHGPRPPHTNFATTKSVQMNAVRMHPRECMQICYDSLILITWTFMHLFGFNPTKWICEIPPH